jgi:hypothetical protein
LHEVGAPDRLAERTPELRLERSYRDLTPVTAGVDVVRGPGAVERHRAGPWHRRARQDVGGVHGRPGERAVRYRQVDVITLAGLARSDERREQPDHREQRSGANVGDLHAGEADLAGCRARDPEHAGTADVVQVVPGFPVQRTVLPVAGDRAVHELRTHRAEVVVPGPEPLGDARPEALDEAVGRGDQPAERGHGVRLFEIEGDRALVAIQHPAVSRLGSEARFVPAHVIAAGGLLDLDDVGPEVGQQASRVRAG